MRVIVLQSGSNGNCVYVETNGQRLLFDAGISGRQADLRLAQFGRDIRSVDGLLISHDHADHIRSAGIFQRKFGLPIHITAPTLNSARRHHRLGDLHDVRHFSAGETLSFGPVRVETIPTPHDGIDGVAFVVDDGSRRFGILTDLGFVFDDLQQAVTTLDAVLLESNYDAQMLDVGPYPEFLKARIRGPGGHLSNEESAELLASAACGRLQWACIGHLSEQNNCPQTALAMHQSVLPRQFPIHVASRYEATGQFEVD